MASELLEKLNTWASITPSKTILTFVDDNGNVTQSITCLELNKRVNTMAALLVATKKQHPKGLGLKHGECCLLVYPPCLDFIVAFLACLRASVIAVPVYPPDPRKMKKDISMFVAVSKNCGAKVALTSAYYYNAKKILGIKEKLSFSDSLPWPDDLSWITTDDLFDVKVENYKAIIDSNPSMDQVAFLQYTSGSTSSPKGVMLTHGNLNHNLRIITSSLKAGRETVVVSWLPQYHDMGLIGAYLGIIYNGGVGVYMSPLSFIRSPMLWIRMISKYRATHLQAPNFAYALCARKAFLLKEAQNVESIDLSSVCHMINGAEPVQSSSITAFYEAFTPYGLKPGVIQPTYGLAEHTVFVCGNGTQRVWVDKQKLLKQRILEPASYDSTTTSSSSVPSVESKEMIGCGIPSFHDHGIDLRIVDPDSQEEMPENFVGEIWISSASKAKGYFNLEDESKEAFHAILKRSDVAAKKSPNIEYLRTGDLGVIHKKELFICGRMKDLIIIRGRNHYPQDLEVTVEECAKDTIRPGCIAAFSSSKIPKQAKKTTTREKQVSTDSEEEQLVIVAEVRDTDGIKSKDASILCRQISASIIKEHGVKASAVVLISPRTIPKTTSGKISRRRCKNEFEEDKLKKFYYHHDEEDNEAQVDLMGADGEYTNAQDPSASVNDISGGTKPPQLPTNENPDAIFDFLITEIANLLETERRHISCNTPLQELGMDSMALTQLHGIINNRYNYHIQEDVMYDEKTTVTTLVQLLCGHGSPFVSSDAMSRAENQETTQTNYKKSTRSCCGCISI